MDQKKLSPRWLTGFLIAPLIPALVMLALAAPDIFNAKAASAIGFLAAVGYGTAVLFGIPAYLLMERYNYKGLQNYLLAGAGIGIAPWLGFFVLSVSVLFNEVFPGHHNAMALYAMTGSILVAFLMIPCMIAGAASAAAFWIIVRPDLRQEVTSSA